jgi:hypothetical protein
MVNCAKYRRRNIFSVPGRPQQNSYAEAVYTQI